MEGDLTLFASLTGPCGSILDRAGGGTWIQKGKPVRRVGERQQELGGLLYLTVNGSHLLSLSPGHLGPVTVIPFWFLKLTQLIFSLHPVQLLCPLL